MRTQNSLYRGGFTLLELMISTSVFTLLMVTILMSVNRQTDALSSIASVAANDSRAQEMLSKLRQTLTTADGVAPTTALTLDLGPLGSSSVQVASTLGFPDEGTLLIDRGGVLEERIDYGSFSAAASTFTNLTRGTQCSEGSAHEIGATVYWAGLAEPIANQVDPPADQFDGVTQEFSGPVFFRGDGIGFSYRVPTDATGGTDYFQNGEVTWGARVGGQDTLDGWSVLYFDPQSTVSEPQLDSDLNGDGDRLDIFDLGQIRTRSWNSLDETWTASEVGLCPPIVLQEQCNWGGDLNGDGFDDPIFLWDSTTSKLHIRLSILNGEVLENPVVTQVSSLIFLRNSAN